LVDDVVLGPGGRQPESAEDHGDHQQGDGEEVAGGGHGATVLVSRRRPRTTGRWCGAVSRPGPSDADEGPVAGVDVALGRVHAAVAGVDEVVAPGVDADMTGLVHQVAGFRLGPRDLGAGRGLTGGAVRQADAVLGVDPLHEAGAVPARRGGTAEDVGGADAGAGGGQDRAALSGRGGLLAGGLLLLLGVVLARGALLRAGGVVVPVAVGGLLVVGGVVVLTAVALALVVLVAVALTLVVLGDRLGLGLGLRLGQLDGDGPGGGCEGRGGLGRLRLGFGLGGGDVDGRGGGRGHDGARGALGLGRRGLGLRIGGRGGGAAEKHPGGHGRAGGGASGADGGGHRPHG